MDLVCPVSGGIAGASPALLVMVAGTAAAVAQAEQRWPDSATAATGSATGPAGPSHMKLANNCCSAAALAATSEASRDRARRRP